MFSLNDHRESNIQFFVKGNVVQLFGEGENLWVGNYLHKKKDKERDYPRPPLLYKIKEENSGWKAHYFNQEVYGWFSERSSAFSPREQVWRRLGDGKIMFKQEVPHSEEVVQIGNDLWAIGYDKHTIHSFTTGRHFTFPHEGGAHALYDIPGRNPLILAGDKQTFYEVPLEKVISFEKVKDVLQGNDARRFDIIVEESV